MKKLLSLMTITVFAAALPAGLFAAEKPAAEKKAAAEKSAETDKKPADKPTLLEKVTGGAKDPNKLISYYGDVASVDASAKTFTFKNKLGMERVFSVGADTKITKDGKPADFGAITVGAYATGSYKKTADGKLETAKVNIGPKPEKKAKPADEKPADKKPEEKKAS